MLYLFRVVWKKQAAVSGADLGKGQEIVLSISDSCDRAEAIFVQQNKDCQVMGVERLPFLMDPSLRVNRQITPDELAAAKKTVEESNNDEPRRAPEAD